MTNDVKFTVKGFKELLYRIQGIENDARWTRRIGYYLAGIVTAIAIKLLFLGG
jgi:hypothetical protein